MTPEAYPDEVGMADTTTILTLPTPSISDDDRYQPYPDLVPHRFAELLDSIRLDGFRHDAPLILDDQKRIICGHMRYKAARQLQLERLPVIVHNGLSEEAKMRLALDDNAVRRYQLGGEQRKRIARQLLSVFPSWSDRSIAADAALSPTLIGSLRREVSMPGVHVDTWIDEGPMGRPIVAKVYPSSEPTKPPHKADELPAEEPGEPIERVAREQAHGRPEADLQAMSRAFNLETYTTERNGYWRGWRDAMSHYGLGGKKGKQ